MDARFRHVNLPVLPKNPTLGKPSDVFWITRGCDNEPDFDAATFACQKAACARVHLARRGLWRWIGRWALCEAARQYRRMDPAVQDRGAGVSGGFGRGAGNVGS